MCKKSAIRQKTRRDVSLYTRLFGLIVIGQRREVDFILTKGQIFSNPEFIRRCDTQNNTYSCNDRTFYIVDPTIPAQYPSV